MLDEKEDRQVSDEIVEEEVGEEESDRFEQVLQQFMMLSQLLCLLLLMGCHVSDNVEEMVGD